ncbi:MAG: response regulator [Planctomycetota bacterium]|nr:response regulator [Planctomycetota bacterium]
MAAIRVLLIEDDPAYVRLIEGMLASSPVGFHVTVANRLTAALSELYRSRFNLILTDLNLPDIRGVDTIVAVRSAESALPIIVLTGLEDADLEEEVLSRGAQLCLRKSAVDTKTLLDAMHQAVRISRQRLPPSKGRQVDRLLTELEGNIIAVKNAVALLDNKQRDSQEQDAVHTIRSHIGKMQDKISSYRRLDR